MYFFSIIIPTCNRNNLLELCLTQLLYSLKKINQIKCEVIVTDDSIDFNAKQLIEDKFNFVQCIKGPGKGPAANRNNGANYANGEWLIFIDDDCLPSETLLLAYFNAILNNKDVLVFEGKIIADRQQGRFNEEAPINLNGGCLWSCNFCIHRTLFFSIGKFDENFPFPSMEDADLNERLVKNYKIVFIDKAFVIHPWRRVYLFKNFSKRLKSFSYFANKHYSRNKNTFRISRIKIFLGSLWSNFLLLEKLQFRGFFYYFEISIFNFITIFI